MMPSMHFRLADSGGGDRHAIVAGHRELEPAAQRMTVNGGDEWLADILQLLQSRVHRLRSLDGLLARLQLA